MEDDLNETWYDDTTQDLSDRYKKRMAKLLLHEQDDLKGIRKLVAKVSFWKRKRKDSRENITGELLLDLRKSRDEYGRRFHHTEDDKVKRKLRKALIAKLLSPITGSWKLLVKAGKGIASYAGARHKQLAYYWRWTIKPKLQKRWWHTVDVTPLRTRKMRLWGLYHIMPLIMFFARPITKLAMRIYTPTVKGTKQLIEFSIKRGTELLKKSLELLKVTLDKTIKLLGKAAKAIGFVIGLIKKSIAWCKALPGKGKASLLKLIHHGAATQAANPASTGADKNKA